MSDNTAIEWTATRHPDGTVTPGATWNFLVGCSKVSAGCTNCYAIRSVARMSGNPQFGQRYQGLVTVGQKPLNWTGKVAFFPEALTKPLGWKEPRRIFVNSLSDLFHPDVPDEWIDQAFAIMALTPRHTYQILTKRPERMAAYMSALTCNAGYRPYVRRPGWKAKDARDGDRVLLLGEGQTWPLPNVWLGTSVEDQRAADERIPHLLNTPAAVRFLSCEPLLGPVSLDPWIAPVRYVDDGEGDVCGEIEESLLDWIITGGESGSGHRPIDADWARSLRDQCAAAGVAYFHKQNGGRTAKANGRLLDGVEHSAFPDMATAGATS